MFRYLMGVVLAGLLALPVHTAIADQPSVSTLYEPFQGLLEEFLVEEDLPDGGLVSAFRYRDAVADGNAMDAVTEQRNRLRQFDPDSLESREEAIAFWLNAYNFFMLAHILENPKDGGSEWIESVRDYGSLFRPYRVFSRDLFDIGGSKYNLSKIEKDILLGDEFKERGWKEARVHFAVNCASVGCPPLRKVIFDADNVDRMMTENTERAMRTERHLRVEGDTLHLSQLFEWYEDDYLEEAETLRDWIADYIDEELRDAINAVSRIRFIDYDWSLNTPENFRELD